MRKLLALFSTLLLALGFSLAGVGASLASGHQFPAQNEPACTAAGGVFSQSGGDKFCVVTSHTTGSDQFFSGKSGNFWYVEFTVHSTITYTKSSSAEITGDPVITGRTMTKCVNPGGNDVALSECEKFYD
jgi:FlaG/FlaF family flagellin (archaellin)